MARKKWGDSGSASGGAVYCLGFIGSLVYFFQQADNLWMVIVGFVKAIVWPAIVAFKLLESFYS